MSLFRRLSLAVRLARLAANLPARLILFAWSLYVTLRAAFPKLPSWTIRPLIRFPKAASQIELRSQSDLWELKDVLLDKEYEPLDLVDPKIIIEIGSNVGISTVYLATMYPNARIFTIEPNPLLAAQLGFTLANHRNVELHAFALAEQDGPVSLFVGGSSLGSSLVHKAGQEALTVEGVSAEHLLKRLGISHADLIKFDIEGAERYLFQNFAGFEQIDAYLGEVHYDRMPVTREEVREHFKTYTLSSYPAGRSDREILYVRNEQQA